MRLLLVKAAACCALAFVCFTASAHAQTPPPPLAVPNPTYAVIPLEIAVNKPAAEVWKRVRRN